MQEQIAHLLTHPVGRPPNYVRVLHASFSYQAAPWSKPRRVVAKVERHPGELYPRVGFTATNLSRPTARVTKFYNGRGTAVQHIKEGKNAINWTRVRRTYARPLDGRSRLTLPRLQEVHLQLHVLAYKMANFLRTLALPDEIEHWSMPTMREKLVSAPRWFGTVGTSPFSLPRSRFHGGCSRRSCGSSNVELIIRKDTADGGRRVDFGLLA